MNKQIAVYDNTVSARTYLSYIAEQAGGFSCIGRDGKLYIKTIGQNIVELPLKYFQNFKWGDKFKISRVRYEDGVQLFENGDTTENTVYINQDNMYIVDQEQIDNIYNEISGLEVYSFEGDSIIDPALDIGDILVIDNKNIIYQGSSQYAGKFKASISSKIQCKSKEETTARVPSQSTVNRRVQSQINQVEGKINQTISEVDGQNQKISVVEQTVNELNSKIGDIADITISEESLNGTVSLASINQSEPIYVKIYPRINNISYVYPSDNLYLSNDLYPKGRILRFENTKTSEVMDYLLPNDLLYYDAENYDEFILDYDAQSCVINKKIGYNADGTTYILETPQKIEYEYPRILLTDGDYTITMLGYPNAYLFVRLMSQNIYTTQFATKAELNSEISQTTNSINLSVDKKLESYPTTTQMNSAISVTANEINSEVSKKVGEDEIISKINQSAEQVQINAEKISLERKRNKFNK